MTPKVREELAALPQFESVTEWAKDLSKITHFTFMDVYTYLIESKDKNFDMKSLRSFKSLKDYVWICQI